MTNLEIRCYLEERADQKYREFSGNLNPTCKKMLGVRIPELRELAKQLAREDWRTYLEQAADDTFEELSLQGLTIGYVKADIQEILPYLKRFIPKVADWSVNDSLCQNFKIAKKNQAVVWNFLMEYKDSESEFEQRVVAIMLMNYFLTEDYIQQTLCVLDGLKHEGYYAKMGVAWALATAYAKRPVETRYYMEEGHNTLEDWTYNKAIQKMLESRRVSEEDKILLRSMKRKR